MGISFSARRGSTRSGPSSVSTCDSDIAASKAPKSAIDDVAADVADLDQYQPKMSVDDFELLSVIGKGSFAKVLQVRKIDTNKIYAMKILKKNTIVQRRQIAHTKTERRVLAEFVKGHPFIVSLRFAFQTPTKLYLVLDYFNGGELFYWLKQEARFKENRARFYAAQIILALDHLHSQGIVYRDLKPENIVLDSRGYLRVTDFGLSKTLAPGEKAYSFVGTSDYLSPEILRGKGYDHTVDYWSLGTLLYEMMAGLPPFYSKTTSAMYEKILNAPISFPKYFSDPAKDLLTNLLEREPTRRLGYHGSEAVKSHPFFQSIDWELLYRKELEPPFLPPMAADSQLDTSNIDVEFTAENPCDSPADRLPSQLQFSGFSYADQVLSISSSVPDQNR